MVFQKLTDEQKQKLFELKETQSKEYIASLRALIMRGASIEEANKVVVERDAVKKAYLEAIELEIEAKREKPKVEKQEATEEAPLKPKRGRKAKKTDEEITNYATSETKIALVEEPAPTKRKRGKKETAPQPPPPEETPPEETPAQEAKPKRGRKPKDFNVELTI